ncbi:GNAT family N-acetyltransferase [Aminobacterium sp. MB27-C1]|uniref:GNAT family N-acetyltransferase n=1 Tax=Aminobacterium sp. MB27-C1 TaxID=3070661 RepID=UPI001BCB1A55|nr:GNAT family N-acetyltransferase [Aminobacterium sp. MB27-C1]WMI71160.1 GNAT family N-acetyltransferase [Aminobacterium sp. MB27-C1]
MNSGHLSIDEYLAIAQATKAFTTEECSVLKEVLLEWQAYPSKDYVLLEEYRKGILAGFLIYGATPMTAFAWDLYWIVVSPDFQRQGIGLVLQEKMEAELLNIHKNAVIRVETSGKQAYAGQRHFYVHAGYEESGRIHNFYGEGDDLVIYTKEIKTSC